MSKKVAIITGASSGIGEACAHTFAENNYRVVLSARRQEKLSEVAQSLPLNNDEVLIKPTDVSKRNDCQQLIESTIRQFGQIDVLVNNAGISMRALFEDVELDVLHQLMDVNFWGAVYCTKYALPHIIDTQGSVIGVSSIAGYKGLPGRAGYSASKFALQGFLETLRIEMRPKNVHVLTVAPGFTSSNIRSKALTSEGSSQGDSPLNEKKLMSPETVSEYILSGVQKRKREIILTRQGKLTVFFNKWLPGLMDKLVYRHFSKEPDSPLN